MTTPITRRDMLKTTGLGLGAAALSSIAPLGNGELFAAPAAADLKRVVFFNLRGGNDGLNTVVPVNLTPYYERRPSLALSSNSLIGLENGPGAPTNVMLNRELTRIRQLWNEGSVAIISNVGYPTPNGSHFVSEDVWSRGVRNGSTASSSGWIARYADLYTTSSLEVVSVGMGTRKDLLGGSSSPFIIDRVSGFEFNTDWSYSRNHQFRLQKVQELLDLNGATSGFEQSITTASTQAHELVDRVATAEESYISDVTYNTNDRESRRLRDIAIMIQGGFETKVFYTGTGGYDTHSGQANRHTTLLRRLDDAIGSFAEDCKDMGVWNDMAVVIISEFGRRNFENGSAGTDHGRANCLFVVGGAVTGGLYGPELTEGMLLENNIDYSIDFRTVYSQILGDHLGDDPAAVFTEAVEVTTAPGDFIA